MLLVVVIDCAANRIEGFEPFHRARVDELNEDMDPCIVL
jgi:hypothetical protein